MIIDGLKLSYGSLASERQTFQLVMGKARLFVFRRSCPL